MGKKINDKNKLLSLFLICLKLGAFTFGGGYAMYPLMEREYVEKKKWFVIDEMTDILAVSQSLPGMLSVNATLMIGYRLFGVLGALVAVLALILPSLIVLSVISYFYVQFSANVYINAALQGIRVAVIALLVQAVIKLGKPAIKGAFAWILAIVAFLLAVLTEINLIFLIIAGAIVGIIYGHIKDKEYLKNREEQE